MNRLKLWLASRNGRLAQHDAALAVAAGVTAFEASGSSFTWAGATAAGLVALKVLLRLVLPADAPTVANGVVDLAPAPAGLIYPTLPPVDLTTNQKPRHSKPVAYTAPRPAQVDAATNPDNITILLPEVHSADGGRLGRHINHDPRSWAYRVAGRTAPLQSVRHTRHVPIYDQGDLGDCVPHAGKGVLSTAPFTRRYTSERGIIDTYEQLTATDDVPGYYKPGDPKSQDTGSDGLSFAKLAVKNKWCSSYQHAFGIDDMLAALQRSAVMCGTSWLTGMDTPNADGVLTIAGQTRGGHEYEADEFLMRGATANIHEDLIGFDNSWGATWGQQGRFYVVVADYAGLLEQQGDVTILLP